MLAYALRRVRRPGARRCSCSSRSRSSSSGSRPAVRSTRSRRCRRRFAPISTPPTDSISRCSTQYGRYLAGLAQRRPRAVVPLQGFPRDGADRRGPAAQPNYRARGGAAGVPAGRAAGRARGVARELTVRHAAHGSLACSAWCCRVSSSGPLLALVFGIYWPIFRVGGIRARGPELPGAAGGHAGVAGGGLRRAPHARQHAAKSCARTSSARRAPRDCARARRSCGMPCGRR